MFFCYCVCSSKRLTCSEIGIINCLSFMDSIACCVVDDVRLAILAIAKGKNEFVRCFQQLSAYRDDTCIATRNGIEISLFFTNSSKGVFQLQKNHRQPSKSPHIIKRNMHVKKSSSLVFSIDSVCLSIVQKRTFVKWWIFEFSYKE